MQKRKQVAEAMKRLLAAAGSEARSVLTTVQGRPLHHVEEGAGPRCVVLLHGGAGGGANWFRVLPELARTYRVLAPDLPGFGLSAAAPLRAPLGLLGARLLHEWLEAVGVRDALVAGTSFGGLAALRLAQQAPDRVTRLLLLDSAGLHRGLPLPVRLAAVPGLTRLGVRPTRRGTAAVFRRLLTRDRSEFAVHLQELLLEYLLASARAAGTAYLARTLRLFANAAGQREVVTPAELGALPMPVHFVWGEQDTFLPLSHAEDAVRHCRRGRLVVVPGAGHSPNWERPAAVVAAIAELARAPAPV